METLIKESMLFRFIVPEFDVEEKSVVARVSFEDARSLWETELLHAELKKRGIQRNEVKIVSRLDFGKEAEEVGEDMLQWVYVSQMILEFKEVA